MVRVGSEVRFFLAAPDFTKLQRPRRSGLYGRRAGAVRPEILLETGLIQRVYLRCRQRPVVEAHLVEAVDLACQIAGTSSIRTANPLERCFRDVQTMRHHVFASEARYGTFGQVYFGVEPDFPVVAFD